MFIKELLLEAVYGNMAIVYHRTSAENIIDKIYDSGFKPGGGALYGSAFYGTYELEPQLTEYKRSFYGDYIIKFAVPLDKFLILEYQEFKKTPLAKKLNSTQESFIDDQLKYFGLSKYEKERYDYDFPTYDETIYDDSYTGPLAYAHYLGSTKYKVNGMIFTDHHDGKVLVCYNLSIIRPLSLSIDQGKTFIPYTEKLRQYIKSKKITVEKTESLIKQYIMGNNPVNDDNSLNEPFYNYINYKRKTIDDILNLLQPELQKSNFSDQIDILCDILDFYTSYKKNVTHLTSKIYYDTLKKVMDDYYMANNFTGCLKSLVFRDKITLDYNIIENILDEYLAEYNSKDDLDKSSVTMSFERERIANLLLIYYKMTNKLYFKYNKVLIYFLKLCKQYNDYISNNPILKNYDKYLN